MADMNLLLEAEKRGILPEDKKVLLDEARKRGLIPGGQQFNSLNTPSIEDTAGQPTPTPSKSPMTGKPAPVGDFEGLDNPITQGIADVVYDTGKGMVESMGRTLSGFQNTRQGFAETQRQFNDPTPQPSGPGDTLKKVGRYLTDPMLADPRLHPAAAGAFEDVNNVSMIASAVSAGYRGVASMIAKAFPGLSDETAHKVAGEIISSQSSKAPLFAKNAEEAAALEKKFPGLKFTVGQSTGDPQALAAEKTIVNMTDEGKMAKTLQQVQADEAIKNRITSTFPGEQGPSEVISKVQAGKDALARDTAVAGFSKERAAQKLAQAQQPEDVGATLLSQAQEGKAASKSTVKEMFGKIDPSTELPSEPLKTVLSEIKSQKWGKGPGDYPSDVMGFIEGKITPPPPPPTPAGYIKPPPPPPQGPKAITFGDTIEMRSQITDAMRAEKAKGPLANETYIKRLNQLLSGVEETQTQLKTVDPAGYKDYLGAKKFYREDYVGRYKQGATANILRKTGTGEQYVDNAMIGKEYFQPGNQGVQAAADFQRTFGGDAKAAQAIKDYAAQSALKASRDELTGEISATKLMGWVNQHRPAITKYGLWNDFRDLTSSSRQLVKAQDAEAAFSKSYASKLLGVDSDKAIANVFSGAGKKDSAAAAQEIMGQLKGDKNAILGMQNATKDYIMEKIASASKDVAGNNLLLSSKLENLTKDLDPALAVIYRDNPSKLTALKETRKALDILKRSSVNLTGSSETAMFLNEAAKKGIGELGGKWATFFVGWAKRASNQEMNKILVNAYFNPEVAQQLVSAVNGKTPPSVFFELMKVSAAGRAAGLAAEGAINQEKAK